MAARGALLLLSLLSSRRRRGRRKGAAAAGGGKPRRSYPRSLLARLLVSRGPARHRLRALAASLAELAGREAPTAAEIDVAGATAGSSWLRGVPLLAPESLSSLLSSSSLGLRCSRSRWRRRCLARGGPWTPGRCSASSATTKQEEEEEGRAAKISASLRCCCSGLRGLISAPGPTRRPRVAAARKGGGRRRGRRRRSSRAPLGDRLASSKAAKSFLSFLLLLLLSSSPPPPLAPRAGRALPPLPSDLGAGALAPLSARGQGRRRGGGRGRRRRWAARPGSAAAVRPPRRRCRLHKRTKTEAPSFLFVSAFPGPGPAAPAAAPAPRRTDVEAAGTRVRARVTPAWSLPTAVASFRPRRSPPPPPPPLPFCWRGEARDVAGDAAVRFVGGRGASCRRGMVRCVRKEKEKEKKETCKKKRKQKGDETIFLRNSRSFISLDISLSPLPISLALTRMRSREEDSLGPAADDGGSDPGSAARERAMRLRFLQFRRRSISSLSTLLMLMQIAPLAWASRATGECFSLLNKRRRKITLFQDNQHLESRTGHRGKALTSRPPSKTKTKNSKNTFEQLRPLPRRQRSSLPRRPPLLLLPPLLRNRSSSSKIRKRPTRSALFRQRCASSAPPSPPSRASLLQGDFSCLDLVSATADRIAALDPGLLGAVRRGEALRAALEEARAVDALIAEARRRKGEEGERGGGNCGLC